MPKVILKKKDLYLGVKYRIGRDVRQYVFIKDIIGTEYVKINDNPCLKTTDSDGNPKSSSCFYLYEEL